jgi:hypothetical protein
MVLPHVQVLPRRSLFVLRIHPLEKTMREALEERACGGVRRCCIDSSSAERDGTMDIMSMSLQVHLAF